MSDISLHDYYAKLDTLLKGSAYDEVIHHCRHILQYFPKNITAYRYLGAALIGVRRWDEASAVLRRVLSVCPDDQQAHSGLSEVYEQKGQPQDAIWHMERAFEQDPNNREAIERLRTLYKRYQQVDQPKVQLTSAAVARQYLRNGAHDQSIETLRGALQRMPDRIDMRLLLAQALWASGEPIEAGEAALDVLQVLPDSLEANRILTELWLSEERPSDAQRYLNRVEAIDPYLALELAQGEPAPGDAFHLDELDYRVYAQHEMTTSRPDWLKEISSDEAIPEAIPEEQSPSAGWKSAILTSFAEQEDDELPAEEGEPFEDWMASVSVNAGTAADLEQDELEIPEEFATLEQALEARTEDPFFESLRADAASSDELPDWFTASEAPAPSATPSVDDGEDPLAWLRESGVEIDDAEANIDVDPFQTDEDMVYQDPSANPHQWAEKYEMNALFHTDALEEAKRAEAEPEDFPSDLSFDLPDGDTPAGSAEAEPEFAAAELGNLDDEDENYDWLQDDSILDEVLGIEQLTQPEAKAPSQPVNEASPTADDSSPDAVTWILDEAQGNSAAETPAEIEAQIESALEQVEDATAFSWELEDQQEDVTPNVTAESELEEAMPSDDKYATLPVWLQSTASDDEIEPEAPEWMPVTDAQGDLDTELTAVQEPEADQPPSQPGGHAPLRGLTGLLNDEQFAWPSPEEQAEPEPEEDDEPWMRQFDAPQTTSLGSADDVPDWLSELDEEGEKLPDSDESGAAGAQPADDEPAFEWLSDDEDLEAFEADIDAETGLDLSSPTAAQVEDQLFGESDESEQPAESTLDSHTFSDVEQASPPPAAGDFGGLSEDALDSSDELPDWLAEIDGEDDPGYTPIPQEALEQSALDAETDVDAEESTFTEEDAAPVTEGDAVSEFVMALDESTEEDFDWPEAATEYEEPEEVPAQPAEEDWLASIMASSEAASEQSESDVNEAAAETTPASSDEYAWLDAIRTDDDAEPEAESLGIEDVLPLAAGAGAVALSQFDDDDDALPHDESDEIETVGEPAEAAIEEPDSADASEISAEEEMPDWMGTLVSNEEMEPVTRFDPEHTPEDDEQPLESDIPDWLSELQPQEEDDKTPSPDDAEPSPESDEIPDWLAELQPIEEDVETPLAAEPEAEDEFSWATDDLDLDELDVQVPAAAALDEVEGEEWLSEPGSEQPAEIDWQAIEDEEDDEVFMSGEGAGAAAAVFAMLESEEEEAAEPSETEESADLIEPMETDAFDEEMEFAADEAEAELMPLADQASYQEEWEDAEAFEEAAEEYLMQTPAENAPDWLNAMVPGIDVDFEAREEEAIEEEFMLGEEIIDESSESEPVSSEFNWLTNLVEEETSEVEIISEDELAPIERHQPRFIFTRPPAWLTESENGDSEPQPESEFSDWVSDDSGDAPSLGR